MPLLELARPRSSSLRCRHLLRLVAKMGRWLTPEQRKGIGKYLKPWGKQPTVATWWIQIITTVVVIIVSMMTAFEHMNNPTFVALPLVTGLFLLALAPGLYGYMKERWAPTPLAEAPEEGEGQPPAGQPPASEEELDDAQRAEVAKQQALREEAVRRELARRREQAAIMAREQALAKQRAEAAQRKAAAEAAEREALEPELRSLMHTRVQIGGLSAKPELNGKCGRTTAYNREKGRFAVAIEGGPSMLLKPANLTAVHDPDAGPPPLE